MLSSWQQVGGRSLDLPALNTKVGVEHRRVVDWRLFINEFKETGLTRLVSLTIQHHYNITHLALCSSWTYPTTSTGWSSVYEFRQTRVLRVFQWRPFTYIRVWVTCKFHSYE